MDGRPSDDRTLDFRADIGLIGSTPYALHTRTDSFFEKCVSESMLTPSNFQVATKVLAMDAHWMTLKDGSPPGS